MTTYPYQPVNAFKTSDGQLFESAGDARLHEIELMCGAMFDEFLMFYAATNAPKGVAAQVMRSIIKDWEHFKAGAPLAGAQKTPVMDADLSARTSNVLAAHGIDYIEDAQAMVDMVLLKVPNLGRNALDEIRAWRKKS